MTKPGRGGGVGGGNALLLALSVTKGRSREHPRTRSGRLDGWLAGVCSVETREQGKKLRERKPAESASKKKKRNGSGRVNE